jgi:hypothetical protein
MIRAVTRDKTKRLVNRRAVLKAGIALSSLALPKQARGYQPPQNKSTTERTSRSSLAFPHDWLDLRRLREYACVSDRTLRSWIHSPVDPLPAVRVGSKYLVKRGHFDLWLERRRTRRTQDVNIGTLVDEIVGRGRRR